MLRQAFLLFFVLASLSLYASSDELASPLIAKKASPPPTQTVPKNQAAPESTLRKNFFVEGKIAYFYPNSVKVRRVYSEAPIYNIEFDGRVYDDLYTWGTLGYFTTAGKTIGERKTCHLTVVPIATGLKYIYRAFCVQPYAGAGLLDRK